jgi:hypothetical protein
VQTRTRKVKGKGVAEWLCTLCTPEHWMKEDEIYWRKGAGGEKRPYRCRVYEKADSVRRHQKAKKPSPAPAPAKRSTANRSPGKKSTPRQSTAKRARHS